MLCIYACLHFDFIAEQMRLKYFIFRSCFFVLCNYSASNLSKGFLFLIFILLHTYPAVTLLIYEGEMGGQRQVTHSSSLLGHNLSAVAAFACGVILYTFYAGRTLHANMGRATHGATPLVHIGANLGNEAGLVTSSGIFEYGIIKGSPVPLQNELSLASRPRFPVQST